MALHLGHQIVVAINVLLIMLILAVVGPTLVQILASALFGT